MITQPPESREVLRPSLETTPSRLAYFSTVVNTPNLFFSDELPANEVHRKEHEAKRICLGCPVLLRCRNRALDTPDRYGIWGAITARERRRELKKHRLLKLKPTAGP